MAKKKKSSPDPSFINLEILADFLSFYRFPLVFAVIGIVLLFLAIGLLFTDRVGDSGEILFSKEATASAEKECLWT